MIFVCNQYREIFIVNENDWDNDEFHYDFLEEEE